MKEAVEEQSVQLGKQCWKCRRRITVWKTWIRELLPWLSFLSKLLETVQFKVVWVCTMHLGFQQRILGVHLRVLSAPAKGDS